MTKTKRKRASKVAADAASCCKAIKGRAVSYAIVPYRCSAWVRPADCLAKVRICYDERIGKRLVHRELVIEKCGMVRVSILGRRKW